MSQVRAVPSALAVASQRPSPLNASPRVGPPCPVREWNRAGVALQGVEALARGRVPHRELAGHGREPVAAAGSEAPAVGAEGDREDLVAVAGLPPAPPAGVGVVDLDQALLAAGEGAAAA